MTNPTERVHPGHERKSVCVRIRRDLVWLLTHTAKRYDISRNKLLEAILQQWKASLPQPKE